MTDKEQLDENIRKEKESGAFYAPAIASRIAASAPGLPSVTEQIAAPTFPVGQGGGGRALAQARSADLDERQFQAKLASDDRDFNFRAATEANKQQLDQLKVAGEQVDQAYAITKERISRQTALDQKMDAFDYLRKAANVSHLDPNFEDKLSQLAALHPLAGADQSVNGLINLKTEARKVYMQNSEKRRAEDTAGEERLLKYVASGLITEKDLPDYDGRGERPAAYSEDGSLNYKALDMMAAKKSAEQGGGAKEAEARIRELRAATTAYLTKPELSENAAATSVFTADTEELASLLSARRGKTPAPTPGVTAPEGAPAAKRSAKNYTSF